MLDDPRELRRRWWLLVLRGAITLAAGIAALEFSAGFGRSVLGSYFAADAAFSIALALAARAPLRMRALFAGDGFFSAVAAGMVFAWAPGSPAVIIVVAAWAIGTGVLEVLAAVLVPQLPLLAWGIALVGLASCCFGLVVFDWVDLAIVGVLYIFAAYAVLVGLLLAIFGALLIRDVRARRR
jgi:uncharacterized membrane protein HdeD (DUF308 family)